MRRALIVLVVILPLLACCDKRPVVTGTFEVASVHHQECNRCPNSHIVFDDGKQRLFVIRWDFGYNPPGLFSLSAGDIVIVDYRPPDDRGYATVVDYKVVR